MDADAKSSASPPAKKPKADQPLKKKEPSQFILTGIQLLKVQAEQLLPPEKASRGFYNVSQKCKHIWTSNKPKPIGTFQYEIKLEGFADDGNEVVVSDGDEVPPRKSFSIELTLEASFNIVGGPITRASKLNSLSPEMIGQVYALAIARVTSLAAELGYSGVKPELTLEKSSIPKFIPGESED